MCTKRIHFCVNKQVPEIAVHFLEMLTVHFVCVRAFSKFYGPVLLTTYNNAVDEVGLGFLFLSLFPLRITSSTL